MLHSHAAFVAKPVSVGEYRYICCGSYLLSAALQCVSILDSSQASWLAAIKCSQLIFQSFYKQIKRCCLATVAVLGRNHFCVVSNPATSPTQMKSMCDGFWAFQGVTTVLPVRASVISSKHFDCIAENRGMQTL